MGCPRAQAWLNKNPLDIYAYQYDLVCNGVELASGAVRNHQPEIMYKAFEQALIDKYNELNPTDVKEIESDSSVKKPIKRIVNGAVLVFNPDGSVYDLKGNKIK